MANIVYLQDFFDYASVDIFPLTEDPALEVISKFGSFAEAIPTFSDMIDQATSIAAGTTGEIGTGLLEAKNLLDIPRWQGTDPIKIMIKLFFENRTNPKTDIFEPMERIMGYSILTKTSDNKYQVPGISLKSLENFKKSGLNQETLSGNSKLLNLAVPGVVYLSPALLERTTPMFSKEITESGFPLWGQLDCSFMGVFPANTGIFEDAKIWADTFKIPSIP